MNELETYMKDNELPDIPAFLKREPNTVEKIPDVPVELERQFVSIEEEGGDEVPSTKE